MTWLKAIFSKKQAGSALNGVSNKVNVSKRDLTLDNGEVGVWNKYDAHNRETWPSNGQTVWAFYKELRQYSWHQYDNIIIEATFSLGDNGKPSFKHKLATNTSVNFIEYWMKHPDLANIANKSFDPYDKPSWPKPGMYYIESESYQGVAEFFGGRWSPPKFLNRKDIYGQSLQYGDCGAPELPLEYLPKDEPPKFYITTVSLHGGFLIVKDGTSRNCFKTNQVLGVSSGFLNVHNKWMEDKREKNGESYTGIHLDTPDKGTTKFYVRDELVDNAIREIINMINQVRTDDLVLECLEV